MSLLILVFIFTCAASVMYVVYRNFPELSRWVSIKHVYFLWIHCYQVIATGLDLKFIFKAKHGTAAHQQSIFIQCKLWVCKRSDGVVLRMYVYTMSVHWWCGWLGLSEMIGMTFSVKKWRKSRFPKTWMMPKLWEPSSPNTKTLTTPKCWWPTSQHMFCILFEHEGRNISVFSLSTCVCLFCILDMLLTNLHPFTLSSLFYVIAGQSQAQIQTKRT